MGRWATAALFKKVNKMCNCNDLSKYDFKSPAMRAYLGTYGEHFSKELCEDAVKMMRDRQGNPVQMSSKEDVKTMLENNGVTLGRNTLYDAVYVHAMARADYWGSSLDDEAHLAMFIGDYLNDTDGYEGKAFNRWYADMCKMGVVLDWEDYLR